jgi:hypothetical protein
VEKRLESRIRESSVENAGTLGTSDDVETLETALQENALAELEKFAESDAVESHGSARMARSSERSSAR